MAAEFPEWMGRRIVSKEHVGDLEHSAATHEFQHGHPRHEAERRAYEDYRRQHHLAAAAHHLQGSRSAQGSGDMDEARKHGLAYRLHLQALDMDPFDGVPEEIRALADGEAKPRHHFTAHKGDALLLDER